MIRINMQGAKELETKLARLNKRGLPFAMRNTMNDAAFKTREVAQRTIRRNMVTRNKWTERSVQVEKARNPMRIEARVGSLQPYMSTQEFGGTKRKKRKEGVPIATGTASGEGMSPTPRKRVPRAVNRLQRIQLKRKVRGKNRKQRNVAAVKEAAASNNKYVFMDLGRTKGIFKVMGGKRKPRVKMIWSLKHQSVNIPRNPWLAPSVKRVTEKMLPTLYARRLTQQLDRL